MPLLAHGYMWQRWLVSATTRGAQELNTEIKASVRSSSCCTAVVSETKPGGATSYCCRYTAGSSAAGKGGVSCAVSSTGNARHAREPCARGLTTDQIEGLTHSSPRGNGRTERSVRRTCELMHQRGARCDAAELLKFRILRVSSSKLPGPRLAAGRTEVMYSENNPRSNALLSV